MPGKKISELQNANDPLTGFEYAPIYQDGNTKKVALKTLFADLESVKYVNPPSNSHSPGIPGQISCDENYLYYCPRTDYWIKIPVTEV